LSDLEWPFSHRAFLGNANRCLVMLIVRLYRDSHMNKTGVKAEQLRVFESVREITGFLSVEAYDDNFTSLSFLHNLRVIHGRVTYG